MIDTIYYEALKIRETINHDDAFLIYEVRDLLENLNEENIELLNCIGLFNYTRIANKDELEYIRAKTAGKTELLLPFCTGLVSAFAYNLSSPNSGNIDILSFKTTLNHSLFSEIKKDVIRSVLSIFTHNIKLVPVKCKYDSSLFTSVLSLADYDYSFPNPYIDHEDFTRFVQRFEYPLHTEDEISELSLRIRELKKTRANNPNTLFNIRFSERLVYLIRKGIFYSEIWKNYPNRCDIMDQFSHAGITNGEVMRLSMFCFAQTGEKEENRNFWPQFQKWFGFSENLCKLNTLRNECIGSFEGIETIGTGKSRRYVQTSLMHSIISNRPLSKELVFKAFERLFRRNGYVGHSLGDVEELVLGMMDSAKTNIPMETRDAYQHNPDQTIDFLKEQYGYYETEMLSFLGDDPLLEISPVRFAITDYIDQAIAAIKQDGKQVAKLKGSVAESRIKAERYHSPYVVIDREEAGKWSVSIHFGYYNIVDENLKTAEEAMVVINDKPVARLEIIDDEIIGRRIPIEREWLGQSVSITVDNDELDSISIPEILLFDYSRQRAVSRRLMRNCRRYLLVAKQDSFSFDDAVYVGTSSIPEMNVYDITLDEDNFILLNGGIVGISGYDAIGHDFLDTVGIVVDAEIVTLDGSRLPIRSDWPRINLITERDDEVIVNVNGHSTEYLEESRCELRDGTGRFFRKILVYEMFPNLKTVDFSVFVGGIRKLSQRFYALRNFEYSLDCAVYKPDDKITVTYMSFDDMKNAFGQKLYLFPSRYETLKFKLIDGNAITITPPIFKFSLANGSSFTKDMAASEIRDGILSECAPGLEKDLRIFVENERGVCGWARKGKGNIWDCSNLLSSNKGASGEFSLISYGFDTKHKICNLYFCPTITEQSIRYHSNRNIRTGREDGIYYHCHLLGVTDMSGLIIRLADDTGNIAFEFTPDSEDMYVRLPDDFRAGRYSISIVEQPKYVFKKTAIEKTYRQLDVLFEGRPVNGLLFIKINYVVVSGEDPRDVENLGIVFKGYIRKSPMKGDSLELDGSFHLRNQYMEKDIDLRVNPCTATICSISDSSAIGIEVTGRDGKPLRIAENNFLNPERPFVKTKEIKSLFGMFEIKKEHKG